MEEIMEETDWDDVVSTLEVIINDVKEASSGLCNAKFFDASRRLNEDALPVLAKLLSIAGAHIE